MAVCIACAETVDRGGVALARRVLEEGSASVLVTSFPLELLLEALTSFRILLMALCDWESMLTTDLCKEP